MPLAKILDHVRIGLRPKALTDTLIDDPYPLIGQAIKAGEIPRGGMRNGDHPGRLAASPACRQLEIQPTGRLVGARNVAEPDIVNGHHAALRMHERKNMGWNEKHVGSLAPQLAGESSVGPEPGQRCDAI